MSQARLPRLLVITDRRQAALPLPRQVEALIAGGCRWVMLREKDLAREERRALALPLARALAAVGGRLSIHGDLELARALGADLHSSRPEGLRASRVRLAPGARLGVSCHDAAELAAAAAAGADYALLSPVFPTASKPGYGPHLGLAGLRKLLAEAKLPVLALGGVTAATAASCLTAGAAGIAVMGEAMRSPDGKRLAARLLSVLDASQ